MRKWLIILLAMLFAFTACQQAPIEPESKDSFDPSKICFNLSIQHPDGTTKGVKNGWEDGDKVFIFISGNTDGYLIATRSNSVWSTAYVGTTINALGTQGTLHAVYLPYGNDAEPTYNETVGTWSFNKGTDTYYFYAHNEYEVKTVGQETVLSARIQMQKPGTYVQFFIPHSGATETIQLACNALCPAGIASLSSDGTITETIGTAGTPITGYADILAGGEGYYVSGIPMTALSATADYYFALKKGDDYSHYYKNRDALIPNKAYQLPDYSNWPRVGGSGHVRVANGSWKTVNEGAQHPWDLGELKNNSFVLSAGEGLPTATDWSNLMDNEKATWMPMDIWGSHGSLVLSASVPQKYLYIPWSGDITNYYWMADFANAFQISETGTRTIPDPAYVPGSGDAYVRTLRKVNCFRIRAKEDGTKVYFKYTDGTVQYSKDYGETWETPPTKANGGIDLDAGEEVCFEGTRTDCNLAKGSDQLFTTNDKVCYIAGDITSLIGYPVSLPPSAFRGAFSKKSTTDTGNNKGKDDEKPAAITVDSSKPADYVDWVDIDPTDPLILPATTAADCYMDMFLGCISLTHAPDLPATVLEDKCYFRMFHSCFGLTSLPSFPSVVTMSGSSTRRRYCYQMFQSCTEITALTEPLFVGQNSTLARGCFEDMFAHCTKLTSVISGLLPATTLAADCYRGMFQDTRITRAPDLLVGELVSECYRFMFSSCKNLNYIKCLATTKLGDKYTTNWVGDKGNVNVPNTDVCIFVRAGTTDWPTGAHGIPSNWTVQDYYPPTP